MKKFLLLLCCVVSVIQSNAQNTFIASVGTNNFEEFYDAVETADNNYLAVGYSSDNNGEEFVYIAKISETGQFVWNINIASSDDLYENSGNAIINTSDKGFAVVGKLNNKLALLKFNSSGTLLWSKEYDETIGGNGLKLLQTSDDGYMLCGSISVPTNGSPAFIIKTDDLGNVVWAKNYFNTKNTSILDMGKTNDNNYVFLSDNYGLNTDTTFIVKIDGSGNVLWSDYLFSTVANTDGNVIVPASDNGILVAGISSSTTGVLTPDGFLFKVDGNGNLLWSKETNSTVNSGAYLFGACETNGGYVAVGDGYNLASDSEYFYLMKTDVNGNLVTSKTIEKTEATSTMYSISKTGDGNYIAAGSFFDGYDALDYDGMLIKFDSDFGSCEPEGSAGELKDYGTFGSTTVSSTDQTSSISVYNKDVTSSPLGDLISVCSDLPLTLLSFNASLQGNQVQLNWKTTNEINTDYFDVERSNDGKTYQSIAEVKTENNRSAGHKNIYSAKDNKPMNGVNLYRLKMVDKDGQFTYSNIIKVTYVEPPVITISPDPVKNILNLFINSKSDVNAEIILTDMSGKIIIRKNVSLINGSNTVMVNVSNMSPGAYIAKIVQPGSLQNIQFMILQ